jgi:hypothetical protein
VGLLTFNALRACDEVIVPVETGYFSLHGLAKMMETLEVLRDKCGKDIFIRVLPTLYDTRTKLAREVLSELRSKFREYLMDSTVNFNTKLKEAASFGQPITEYDPGSRGYKDFVNLARELMGHRPVDLEPTPMEKLSRPAELVQRAKQLAQLTNYQFGRNAVTTPGAGSLGGGSLGGGSLGGGSMGGGSLGGGSAGAGTTSAPAGTPGMTPAAPVMPGVAPMTPAAPARGEPATASGMGASMGAGMSGGTAGGSPVPMASGTSGKSHMGASGRLGLASSLGDSAELDDMAGTEDSLDFDDSPVVLSGTRNDFGDGDEDGADFDGGNGSGSGSGQEGMSQSGMSFGYSGGVGYAGGSSAVSLSGAGGNGIANGNGHSGNGNSHGNGHGTGNGAGHGIQNGNGHGGGFGNAASNARRPAEPAAGTGGLTMAPPVKTTAQKIEEFYGVKQVGDEVVFSAHFARAKKVLIAGDFNNWSPMSTPMVNVGKPGEWRMTLPLHPGRYRYRFVVDGKWMTDPNNKYVEVNQFGELNNVVEVD